MYKRQVIYSIVALQETHVKNFLIEASKSGNAEYRFVKPVECQSGRLKNTYVITPIGKVVFKQLSADGTIGPVCIK